ncbi:MAG: hypothetical protein ACLUZ6_07030 [Lachnospira eligens]
MLDVIIRNQQLKQYVIVLMRRTAGKHLLVMATGSGKTRTVIAFV